VLPSALRVSDELRGEGRPAVAAAPNGGILGFCFRVRLRLIVQELVDRVSQAAVLFFLFIRYSYAT